MNSLDLEIKHIKNTPYKILFHNNKQVGYFAGERYYNKELCMGLAVSDWSGDLHLGKWKAGVAFVYDGRGVIVGCWDGQKHYDRFEINENKKLHDLLHLELKHKEETNE